MSQAAAEGGAAASGGRPSPPASSSSSSAFPAIDGWAAELIADAAENGEPRRKAAAEEEEARPLPYCLPPETGKEIRSDTSILLEEMIPLIKAKVSEMNNVYTKVDKLEAFVKMAGHHVSFLEEQILQAEKTHAGCPSSIQKLLGSLVFPLFKKTYTPDAQKSYNLPELYRTEDYFPIKCIGSKYQSH
ncbi:breast carcinoma-amplified sequence 4 isoform X4 [Ahaetulla prasina]|uniref:breast carcinoma-amplified sequence 4 isoform X4 n=1 Tax=Ahaetulla prasina TaxID=499056 RepID=UPI00264768C2|nr:breast carcinoma-amplified sequence 4 isoform X4 [Ahaetulla prasina]